MWHGGLRPNRPEAKFVSFRRATPWSGPAMTIHHCLSESVQEQRDPHSVVIQATPLPEHTAPEAEVLSSASSTSSLAAHCLVHVWSAGLLLPKPIRRADCHGLGVPDLRGIVRRRPLVSVTDRK